MVLGEDSSGGFDPVEFGHADVHQDDVRAQFAGEGDRFGAICGFSDDFDVGFGSEDHPKSGADELLVIGDQDAHAHASAPCSPRGIRATNCQPSSSCAPACNLPSHSATRSRIASVGQPLGP